ncbi:hypothetical protein Tdes44962_MAKER09292 [Teratosphaeria destructans]|uniref:Uncharacterized protein n=1 Tax=Teratosphaeria destructans TaxID=418781 RepID=A0A9W7SU86_9PEZI|nr:hypothetical protein Tdes44962_MAKER09292 [Teratosphaeria destructans]
MAVSLTPADAKLLVHAWHSFEDTPKVDTQKLAAIGNYKNAASANACWHSLRKKLLPKQDAEGTTAEIKLSEKDCELLGKAWASMRDVPKVDTKKLAELAGYKTAASANACWHTLRKKLFTGKEDAGHDEATYTKPDDEAVVAPTPKGKKRKAVVKDEEPTEDNDRSVIAPAAKKTATTKKRKTAKDNVKQEEVIDDDEAAKLSVPAPAPTKKQGGRKSKAAATTGPDEPSAVGTAVEGTADDKSDAAADDSITQLLKVAAADDKSDSAAPETGGDREETAGVKDAAVDHRSESAAPRTSVGEAALAGVKDVAADKSESAGSKTRGEEEEATAGVDEVEEQPGVKARDAEREIHHDGA